MTNTLVLGVGNVLLADEGAGVHALRYLQGHYDLHDVTYLDAGTLSFTLASDIADADHMVVFDAAQIGAIGGSAGGHLVAMMATTDRDDGFDRVGPHQVMTQLREHGGKFLLHGLLGRPAGPVGGGVVVAADHELNGALLFHRRHPRRPCPGEAIRFLHPRRATNPGELP